MKVIIRFLLFILITANLVLPCNVLATQASSPVAKEETKSAKWYRKKENIFLVGSTGLLILYLLIRKKPKPYTEFTYKNIDIWERYVSNELLEEWLTINHPKHGFPIVKNIQSAARRELLLIRLKVELQKPNKRIRELVEELESHVNTSPTPFVAANRAVTPTQNANPNNNLPVIVASSPQPTIDEKPECPVCSDVLEKMPITNVIQLTCKHIFCRKCLGTIRPNNSRHQCPICRKEITPQFFKQQNITPDNRSLNHVGLEDHPIQIEEEQREFQQYAWNYLY